MKAIGILRITTILMFIFTLSVTLLSCSDSSKTTEVSLKVGNPVQVDYDFRDSEAEVDKVYRALIATASKDSIDFETLDGGKRLGFHYYQNGRCFIVMVKPSKISYEKFEKTLGHEMVHCLFGEFHDNSGKLPNKLIIK